MARSVRITDITPKAGIWPNLLDAKIPGAPDVQVARTLASLDGHEQRIAVAIPEPGESPDRSIVVSAVRAYLPDFGVGIVENNDTGTVNLWVDSASGSEFAFLAAAAAAKLQISWGWDDSPSITVNVRDQSFRFQVEHIGERSHQVLELPAA